MPRAPEFLESAATRRLSRPLTVIAALLYAATVILPFVHGTIRILVIPVSRELTLPAFMHHVADKQPTLVVALIAVVVIVLPVLLLLAALMAAWVPTRAMPPGVRTGICWLRWRAWVVVAWVSCSCWACARRPAPPAGHNCACCRVGGVSASR